MQERDIVQRYRLYTVRRILEVGVTIYTSIPLLKARIQENEQVSVPHLTCETKRFELENRCLQQMRHNDELTIFCNPTKPFRVQSHSAKTLVSA